MKEIKFRIWHDEEMELIDSMFELQQMNKTKTLMCHAKPSSNSESTNEQS